MASERQHEVESSVQKLAWNVYTGLKKEAEDEGIQTLKMDIIKRTAHLLGLPVETVLMCVLKWEKIEESGTEGEKVGLRI